MIESVRVAVIADELLSIDGLEIDGKPVALRDEQRARLSREEVAAMLTMGVHFEAVLMSGFARQVAESGDLADPRVMYMLHEIGEEARHSRAFIRLIGELAPTAKNPLDTTIANFILNKLTRSLAKTHALLLVMVLAGRAPDLVDVERGDRLPRRKELRRTVTRPVLEALLDAGVLERGRIPRGWRKLCTVDRHGVSRAP